MKQTFAQRTPLTSRDRVRKYPTSYLLFAIAGASAVASIAYGTVGDLYEADFGSGNVFRFTPVGARTTFATDLSLPFGLAFDINGNLYEADEGSGSVLKFSPTGAKTTFATGLSSPALAFDGSGNLFVSNFTAARASR
jgi:hypothetical protein